MKRIIIAVSVTLVFVQLVKSQTAEAVAQICREIYSLRMQADDFCTGVNAIPNLFICEPTCRNVIEDLSDKCDNGNGIAALDTDLLDLCSPCGVAQQALVDGNCYDQNSVCMGMCRTYIDDIFNNCDNETAASYSSLLDDHCSPCGMAQQAVNGSTCLSSNDTNSVCMGMCRTYIDDIINKCDKETAASYSSLLDDRCSPCGMAQQAVVDSTCLSSNDTNSICMGMCRNYIDDIFNNCDNETAASYTRMLDRCSPCNMAQQALVDGNCYDQNSVCMGMCRTYIDDIFNNCDNKTAASYSSLLDRCSPCGMAQLAVVGSTCLSSNDTNSVCMGMCRTHIDGIINNCDNEPQEEEVAAVIAQFNQRCGDPNIAKASGTITLLIVAICTLMS